MLGECGVVYRTDCARAPALRIWPDPPVPVADAEDEGESEAAGDPHLADAPQSAPSEAVAETDTPGPSEAVEPPAEAAAVPAAGVCDTEVLRTAAKSAGPSESAFGSASCAAILSATQGDTLPVAMHHSEPASGARDAAATAHERLWHSDPIDAAQHAPPSALRWGELQTRLSNG